MQHHLLDLETAILTSRTVFRRFREGEGKNFFKLFQDNHSRISDYFGGLTMTLNSEADAEFWIRKKLANWLLRKEYYFGIWDKRSAELIGFICLVNIEWDLPKGEVQFFIDKDFAKKGIMTEVLKRLTAFAFDQVKMQKLTIKTAMEYYPPQRLARKCGFNREGDLRSELRKPSGEIMDVMLFGLSFTTYEKY